MGLLKTLTINGTTYEVVSVVPAASVTLLANAWVGSGNSYSQEVAVPGVTSHAKVDLQLTVEQLEEFHYKILAFVAENNDGIITVYSIGDKPTGDHTIQITKTEVEGSGPIRGNTVGTTMPRPDWNQNDPTQADYIHNKPYVPTFDDNTVGDNVWTSQKVASEIKNGSPAIVCEASGEVITLTDASDRLLRGLTLYGKTTQDGAPTPEAPVALESAGASGSIGVTVAGKNIFGGDALADKLVELAKATKNTEAGTVAYTGAAVSGDILFNSFKPNTQYTFVFYGRNSSTTSAPVNLGVAYTDGSSSGGLRFPVTDAECYLVYTTAPNKTVQSLFGYFSGGTTILHYDKCGIFEGVLTEADFEPYKGQTLSVSTVHEDGSPNGLPGIPVSSGGNYTDESGQQWKCDEVDLARGMYVQRVGVFTSDGTESWVRDTTNVFGYKKLSSIISQNRGRCSHFVQKWVGTGSLSNGEYTLRDEGYVYVKHTGYDTVDAFKAWLAQQYTNGTPLTLHYQLAEPIPQDLSAEELAAYAALHTYKPNTTVYNDSGAGMGVSYVADTKMYIDNKLAQISAAMLNA